MAIRVFLDGVPLDVSKDELFEMASRGEIGPDTIVESGDTHTTAGKVKGIMFGNVVPPLAVHSKLPPLPDEKKTVCVNCGTILVGPLKYCSNCGAPTVLNQNLTEIQDAHTLNNAYHVQAAEMHRRTVPLSASFGGIVFVLIVCFLVFSFFHKNPIGSRTLEQFDRIQNGMTYAEVVSIVGSPSETSADSEIAGTRTAIYTWHVSDSIGANFSVTVQDEKVIMKAQAGLR